MPFPKLNLKGIGLKDIKEIQPAKISTPPIPVQKQKKERAQIVIETKRKKPPKLAFLFAVIVGLYLMNITVSWFFRHPPKAHHLRKILRMTCASSISETQCSTPHRGGDYVVNIDECDDVYDFNGIPWVELKKDKHGNYRIPSTSDLTLTIQNPCPKIIATVDTTSSTFSGLASRSYSGSDKPIKKLIWVTDTCWEEFTLSIDEEIIFDKTPEKMIDSQSLKSKKAYTYVPDTVISGSVSVKGRGCTKPIIIYTLRQ